MEGFRPMDTNTIDAPDAPFALLSRMTFSLSTETEKEKLSVLAIDTTSEVTDPKLGMPNPSLECATCGSKDLKSCEGHFGVIRFPFTIVHPYFFSEVVQILNGICPACKSIRKYVNKKGSNREENPRKSCKYCTGKSPAGWYPKMRFKVLDPTRKLAIIAVISGMATKGKRGALKKLAADYWEIIPKDDQEDESDPQPNRRILTHAQVRYLLKDVDPNFIKRFVLRADSIFLNSLAVTPNGHRISEVMHLTSNGQRLIFDERTRACKKLVDFRGPSNELALRVIDSLQTSKLHPDKTVQNDVVLAQQRKNSSDITSNESGSRWMKVVVLGKRNDHSMRMVVVGDPNLKLHEIGIPCHVAERLLISEHLTSWNWEKLSACCEVRLLEKGEIHVRREGKLARVRCTDELHIGDVIYRPVNDGDTLLINRPPSIHQHSLIAFSVKVLPVTSVLAINPLCCSPFRGDFDGDCLHGYVPQSIGTRVELTELVALDKQLTNAQSGRNLLSLSQDSLLAAHLVMEDGVFLNQYEMQQLLMFCHCWSSSSLPSIVRSPSVNVRLWTGKQLINMLLPRGFDYDFPSNNVVIRDGELLCSDDSLWLRDTDGNIFQSLVKHFPAQFLDFLHAAQQVFCEWLSLRGLSVSLSDLYLCSSSYTRDLMTEEIMYGLQDAEYTTNLKQFMVDSNQNFLAGNDEGEGDLIFDVEQLSREKQGHTMLSQACVDSFKDVFREIQGLVYRYASKDNSLLAMFKAGSKGNLTKLVQHSMCLGLQHSLAYLSFRMPRQLTCAAWNEQKKDDISQYASRQIPSAVVEASFLTGLNPLECFVHSITNRDSSFSDNADLPGTLSRRLMFFMRDAYAAYDGTVRNAYGNQIVQFSYGNDDGVSGMGNTSELIENYNSVVGKPVGSLAGCAISEVAYSALDQPISLLEKSPLLNLKNVLECGVKKTNVTASLFLSEKLGRQRHGFEYAALEVQNQLQRVLLSDIVSFAGIIFTPHNGGKVHYSPWVCHFHVCKEILKKRSLNLYSIVDCLNKRCRSKTKLPRVQIKCQDCSEANVLAEKDSKFCISVTVIENSKNSFVKLTTVEDMISFLLATILKGCKEIKKVDILWYDRQKLPKSRSSPHGELYLKASMSRCSSKNSLWNELITACFPVMNLIDWTRSHPDNVKEFCFSYGIDAAWRLFLNNLESTISDVGKTVRPEHLRVVANCLSVTGEFVSLNSKGLKRIRDSAGVSSPFVQACFATPGATFIKAAKQGITDNLQGTLDSLAWGKVPTIGTGQFDIVYSGMGHESSKLVDVYSFLSSQISSKMQNVSEAADEIPSQKSDKCDSQVVNKFNGCTPKASNKKAKGVSKAFLRSFVSYDDILRLSHALRKILNKYPLDQELNEADKNTLMMALYFHPRRDEKIGAGAQTIKVVNHPEHVDTRCFSVVRTDGTSEDFSYRKCVHGALELIAPQKAKKYEEKYLQYRGF